MFKSAAKIRIKQELSYKSRFIRYKKSFMQHLLQCMNDSFPHISLEATRLYFPHQPFQRIDSLDTIIICRRVFIERQDILGILVLDLLKRSEFTLQGLLYILKVRLFRKFLELIPKNVRKRKVLGINSKNFITSFSISYKHRVQELLQIPCIIEGYII